LQTAQETVAALERQNLRYSVVLSGNGYSQTIIDSLATLNVFHLTCAMHPCNTQVEGCENAPCQHRAVFSNKINFYRNGFLEQRLSTYLKRESDFHDFLTSLDVLSLKRIAIHLRKGLSTIYCLFD